MGIINEGAEGVGEWQEPLALSKAMVIENMFQMAVIEKTLNKHTNL